MLPPLYNSTPTTSLLIQNIIESFFLKSILLPILSPLLHKESLTFKKKTSAIALMLLLYQ